jgi:hypothetical protein
MRIKIFWNIMLHCLANSNRLQGVGSHLPEDRGRKFFRNLGTYLPVDEAIYFRRIHSLTAFFWT